MRKFAKYILIGAGILLLMYALAVLGLNIYLQSEVLQKRIRTTAESVAGSPVRIQGTHYTPWSGFIVTGISMRGHALPGQQPFLEANSVSFRFDLFALLQGKLTIQEVEVVNPSLVSYQPRPEPVSEPVAPEPLPSPVPPPPVTEEHPPEIVITAPSFPPPIPLSSGPVVEVKRIRIENGMTRFFDSKGASVFAMTGIGISGDFLPDRSIAGTFRIAGMSVGLFIHPKHLRGTFTWKNGKLTIPDLQADWAGGKLTGSLEINPGKGFAAVASADGVLIKKLAADAGIDGESTRGSLSFTGKLQGIAGKPETFKGKVDVALQQARFQPLDFLRQIGELMNIQELRMLELKTATAAFSIQDRKVMADSVVLESENLVIDAKGPVGFDGKMKLQARLHLNERLRKDLAGLLGNNFKESERPGYEQMPFSITGTVSRPKTDLLDKLTGFRIGQDVGGLLKNLFRAPSPEKKKDNLPAGKEPGGG